MRAALVILWHSVRRVRNLVLSVGLLLALFQIIIVFIAGVLESRGQFAQLSAMLPPFVQALLGPAMASFLSFAGIVSIGYYEPAILGAVIGVAIAVSTQLTLEIESGFIDLMLARPVARPWIVTRSAVVAVLAVMVMIAMMLAGTWAGLAMLAPATAEWPTRTLILSLAVNLGLLGICWSGIALAIGGRCAAAELGRSVERGGRFGGVFWRIMLLDCGSPRRWSRDFRRSRISIRWRW